MANIDPNYRKSIEKINSDGEDYTNNQMKDIYKLQKQNLDEVHTAIGLLFLKQLTEKGLLKLTPSQKTKILSDFKSKFKNIGKDLGQAEVNKVTEILSSVYENTFYQNIYNMDKYFNINLKFDILSKELIEKAVNNKLDGELFSSRIWKNKADMIDKLYDALNDIVNGNVSVDKAGQLIENIFNVSAYDSKRIVITELTRIQCQASTDEAINTGVIQHMWSSTLDSTSCNECAELDGKVYDIDNDSAPEMPLHPNCRCCWINVPFEGWTPTKRKDNETKEIIDYQTYDEWSEEKGIN